MSHMGPFVGMSIFAHDIASNMAFKTSIYKKWLSIIAIYSGLYFTSGESVHPHDVNIREVMHSYTKYSSMHLFKATDFWMGINDPSSDTGEYPFRVGHTKSHYMGMYPVTNAHFWEFQMKKKRYRTEADTKGWSWVFDGHVSLDTKKKWAVEGTSDNWLAVKKANWEHPEGPDSLVDKRWNHPVVHISYYDAETYCKWRGKRLPTEAEWERAARGTQLSEVVQYPWGDNWQANRANIWQGKFPDTNLKLDGFSGTAPVDAYRSQNSLGMYDMIGNVWEWTASPYYQPLIPHDQQERQFILKGGSFLDTRRGEANYVVRSSQRMPQAPDYTSNNIGFRCVMDSEDYYSDWEQKRRDRQEKKKRLMAMREEL